MTERLDRIEALVETNAQAIERNVQAIERNAQAIERNAQAIERNARAIDDANRQLVITMNAVDRLATVQMQTLQAIERDREIFQAFQQKTDATLASINAALERIDRVLDYLLRNVDNP